MNNLSPELLLEIGGFVSGVISGRFKSAKQVAKALDKLRRSAWIEAGELPPESPID